MKSMRIPNYMAQDEVMRDELIDVLPAYRPAPMPINVGFPLAHCSVGTVAQI